MSGPGRRTVDGVVKGRITAVLTATVLAIAAVVVTVPRATAWTRLPLRVSGADRYETAVELSRAVFPSGAKRVIVATGESFPDALAAAAFAGTGGAPLLLTPAAALPDPVVQELARLAPEQVFVVGGATAVHDHVLDQISALLGVTPVRIGGTNRYDTAATIASGSPQGGAVFVATGEAFPDGLAAGAAAGATHGPLLLVQSSSVPPETRAVLEQLRPATITVVGGATAVSDAVIADLQTLSPSVERLAGADRFATAAAVAQRFFPHPPEVLLASGLAFPDALAAGAVSPVLGAPLVLSLPACVPPSSVALLQASQWPNVTTVGGEAAVWDAAMDVTPCSPVPDGDVAPGVHLETRVIDGPNVVHIVTIDRAQGMDIRSTLATGQLGGRLPTTEIARRWSAAVAVNGDFFLPDGQPAHAFATGGRVIKAPALVEDQIAFDAVDPHAAFFGTPQMAMIAAVEETGAFTAVDHFNDGDPTPDETAMYTPEGEAVGAPPAGTCAARLTPVGAPDLDVNNAAFQLHTVTSVTCGAPEAVGTDDILTAVEGSARAAFINSLVVGQHVKVEWSFNPNWPDLLDSTGSNTTLVHNGAPSDDVVFGEGEFYESAAPRTAVGQLADGRDVLVTVDGRQPGYSVGLTAFDLASYLVSLGVVEAGNLDGGGSATLSVGGLLVNRPSDLTGERPVGTALVVVPHGTVEPPLFAPPPDAPPPQPDQLAATDVASIGGYAWTRQVQGASLPAAWAPIAATYAAAQH